MENIILKCYIFDLRKILVTIIPKYDKHVSMDRPYNE